LAEKGEDLLRNLSSASAGEEVDAVGSPGELDELPLGCVRRLVQFACVGAIGGPGIVTSG